MAKFLNSAQAMAEEAEEKALSNEEELLDLRMKVQQYETLVEVLHERLEHYAARVAALEVENDVWQKLAERLEKQIGAHGDGTDDDQDLAVRQAGG